jgi:hypothetical protein
MTPEDILSLVEDIWLPLDPDMAVEWRRELSEMDLEVAERAVLVLRDAHPNRPSLALFTATYRGLKAKPVEVPRTINAAWFDEQRAKLRPVGFHPET